MKRQIVKIQKLSVDKEMDGAFVYTKNKGLYDFVPLKWFPEDFFDESDKRYVYASVDEKNRLVLEGNAPRQSW